MQHNCIADDYFLISFVRHRTDGSDAFDTLFIGCEKFPQHSFDANFLSNGVL